MSSLSQLLRQFSPCAALNLTCSHLLPLAKLFCILALMFHTILRAFLSGTFLSSTLRNIFNMKSEDCFQNVPYLFVLSGMQRFLSFGPRRCRAYPEHVVHHAKVSPLGVTLLTMSSTPKCASLHLFSLWLESFPCLLGSSYFAGCCFTYFFHISCSDMCSLMHTTPFSQPKSTSLW